MDRERHRVPKSLVAVAVAVGVAAGSYGIASAATGSGSSSSGSTDATTPSMPSQAPSQSAPDPQSPWGGQRSDETVLSGDTASKVEQAALAEVPNGTIVRVETDADGHSAYEAHMTKADGTPVTVYVDKSFDVVSVETR